MNNSVERSPGLSAKSLLSNVKNRAEDYETQARTTNQDMQMLIWAEEQKALVDALYKMEARISDLEANAETYVVKSMAKGKK